MASSSKSTMLKSSNNGLPLKGQPQAGPSGGQSRLKGDIAGMTDMQLPSERLGSFRMPRDLTLGGMGLSATRISQRATAASKKVYMPNLNAVRNKNVDVKTSRDTTVNPRGRGGGRGRGAATRGGRGGQGGRGGLIASTGLFSEGAGDGMNKRTMTSRLRSATDAGSDSTQLRRPTIIKKEKIDPMMEQKQIRDIYELDNELMDDDHEQSSSNDGFHPINLIEVKQELKLENRMNGLDIKTEPGEPSEMANVTEEYPQSLEEYFQRTNAQMFLLQLPDSLPGHGPIQEPAESAEFERPESPDPTSQYCTMAQLDDGVVGRLVRYKSGKTKLILGDARFDLHLGMNPGFIQDVISINANTSERSGNMVNLGHIGAKFSAIPDWEYMLETAATTIAADS